MLDQGLSETEISHMFMSVENTLDRVMHGRSKEISFEDSYDNLYRLFKCQKGKLIQDVTISKIRDLLVNELRCINPENDFLEEFARRLVQFLNNVEKVMKIYFYLEQNYFEQELKCSLKTLIYSTIKNELLECRPVLQKFINQTVTLAFEIKNNLHKNSGLFRDAIHIITKLDGVSKSQQNSLFDHYFSVQYISILKKLIGTTIRNHRGPVSQLLSLMNDSMIVEQKFLEQYFSTKQTSQFKKQVLSQFYKCWVTDNMSVFFKLPDIDKVLQQSLMEVYRIAEKDKHALQQFTNQYIQRLKLKFTTLNRDKCIVEQFNQLYKKSMVEIQDFQQNIVAQVKLTFQVWLNKESQAIDSLNTFIIDLLEDMYRNKENRPKKGLNEFMLVFKFIKDKDLFERGYRKLMVDRMINGHVDFTAEGILLSMMKEECGTHFIRQMEGILEEYENSVKMNINHCLVFSEDNWPYKESFKERLDADLIDRAKVANNKFLALFPNKLLRWHPILGNGQAAITLNQGTFTFNMTTAMLNFLLMFNSVTQFQIGKFLKVRHVELTLVASHILALLKSGLIKTDQPVNNLNQLTSSINVFLNLDFQPGKNTTIRPHIESGNTQFVKKEQLNIDRKIMVDSIIIKTMKSRKVLSSNDLFDNVFQLIEKRGFSPNGTFIKNCLDDLITRGFIRSNETDKFEYMP